MTAPRAYRLGPELTLVGPDASRRLPTIIAVRGRSCFILADRDGRRAAARPLAALGEELPDVRLVPFEGECTEAAIERIATESEPFDVLLAVGGGKVLDAAKAAAAAAGIPCVTLPTSAATCAAYTPLSILHEPGGAYVESRRLSQPVAAMILDPHLILTAPPRLLAAGIADAVARAFDTLLAARIAVPTSTAGLSLAVCSAYLETCLLPLGKQALGDNALGETTDAFVRVVEACVLGAGLAGETGARFFGRSFSHAVGYALSHIVDPARVLHGEAVGLGILVHCILDSQPPVTIERMLAYFEAWGLPKSLSAIGVRGIDEGTALRMAELALGYLDLERAVPFPVGAKDLLWALRRLEAIANAP
jgi:glycerol dehydrogenase-like iron-containing ADH family enzyme